MKRERSVRVWKWFMRPSTKCGWGVFFMVGGFFVVSFVWGFNVFAGYTNRMDFCVSCHEMSYNYEEYKKSIHYNNRTGVRAECADCHVPKEFGPKLVAKVMAAKDVWHTILGTMDTPEKFEAHRMGMAKAVWAKMEATGSRECRNCHRFDGMDFEQQGRRSRSKHAQAIEEGKTCINCHKGVVHELPQGFERD